MSSHPELTTVLLRKASRIAGRLNRDWYCVYVQTPAESAARIDAARAAQAGREHPARRRGWAPRSSSCESEDVADAIRAFAREAGVTLIIVGQSRRQLVAARSADRSSTGSRGNPEGLDVLVVSLDATQDAA